MATKPSPVTMSTSPEGSGSHAGTTEVSKRTNSEQSAPATTVATADTTSHVREGVSTPALGGTNSSCCSCENQSFLCYCNLTATAAAVTAATTIAATSVATAEAVEQ